MRSWFVVFTILVPLAAPCGKDDRRSSPLPAPSICTVLAKAADYDGKDITVRVIYQSNPEGGISYGPECPHEYVSLRKAPGFRPNKGVQREWRKMGAYRPVDLVLRGRFTICRGQNCFVGMNWSPYQIEVREYLFVQPAAARPK